MIVHCFYRVRKKHELWRHDIYPVNMFFISLAAAQGICGLLSSALTVTGLASVLSILWPHTVTSPDGFFSQGVVECSVDFLRFWQRFTVETPESVQSPVTPFKSGALLNILMDN